MTDTQRIASFIPEETRFGSAHCWRNPPGGTPSRQGRRQAAQEEAQAALVVRDRRPSCLPGKKHGRDVQTGGSTGGETVGG